MGDSGAMLLGFVLATVAVQGLLKTAATVALFFPLLVLAVPIIDTSFVVVRRLKYGQPVYAPDQAHLHHRFLRHRLLAAAGGADDVGVVRDAGAAALATRFIPFRAGGNWHLSRDDRVGRDRLVALVFSVYVVYVLEIVKLAALRAAPHARTGATRHAPLGLNGHVQGLTLDMSALSDLDPVGLGERGLRVGQ